MQPELHAWYKGLLPGREVQIPSGKSTQSRLAAEPPSAGRAGQTRRRSSLHRAYPLLLIAGVAWFAHFLHFTAFGFYEDDWYYFAQPYQTPASAWFAQLRQEVLHFNLGRPLQNICMYVFGYIGSAAGSIAILYLLAFALLAASAGLMYAVLRNRFPVRFCTTAVLIFVLSPLTTIKQFLNYALTIGPGFTILFVGLWLYSRGRRIAALLPAAAALLTYEPLFLLYFAAPLFRRGKKRGREWAVHGMVCAGVMIAYILARESVAEARVAAISSGPLRTVLATLQYCAFFTISSFQPYPRAAYVGFRELMLEPVAYVLLAFLPALLFLYRLWPARLGRSRARRRWWLWNGVAAGLLLTALGYGLAYFHLNQGWFPLSGRDTRVSGAASFGSSIFVAALLAWIGQTRARLSRVLTTALLTALFLYSFVVQRDYTRAWTQQRNFLTQAIMLSPDVHPDSHFIVQTRWLLDPLFPGKDRRPSIGFSRHGLQVSMQALFGWQTAPTIFFVYSDQWPQYLAPHADGKLYWTQASFPGGWERNTARPIAPGRIIVMREEDNGSLIRIDAPIWAGGKQIVQIRQPSPAVRSDSNWPSFPHSPLLTQVVPAFALSAVMSNLSEVPTGPQSRIETALSLDRLQVTGAEAAIERSPFLKVTTPSHFGYFAAAVPIHAPRGLYGACFVYLRARVLHGRIGLGLLDSRTREFQLQRPLQPSAEAVDVYLPVQRIDRTDQLVIYNGAEDGVGSQILIEDAAFVVSRAGDR